jgi:integrase
MSDLKYLTTTELLKVLAIAKKKGPREHAMFLLAYCHGLRVGEITHLTLADIRGGFIDVQRLKGAISVDALITP